MKRLTFFAIFLMIFSTAFGQGPARHGMVRGYLARDGRPVFPIGIYEMPKTDAELESMAQAGINLVRCYIQRRKGTLRYRPRNAF